VKFVRRRWFWILITAVIVATALVINAPGLVEFFWRIKLSAAVARLPAATPLTSSDRLLVIAPHPDDEVLACGGLIIQALGARASGDIIWLTSGDGYEWDEAVLAKTAHPNASAMQKLGEQRMAEARNAARVLHLAPERLHFLGYPDGGLLRLFLDYYYNPYSSHLTGARAVPYRGAVRPGASYTGENLELDLAKLIDQVQPTIVCVPAPQDRHPDHRAAAYFALRAFGARHQLDRLRLYLVHGGMEWPLPKGLHRNLPLAPAPRGKHLKWVKVDLTPAEEELKLAALREHKSQLRMMPHFLDAFIRQNELFSLGVEPE
jgi:LmbE family N-acetylglucosaminyl deacetylase